MNKPIKTLTPPKVSDPDRKMDLDTYKENHKDLTKQYESKENAERKAYASMMRKELQNSPGYSKLMSVSEKGNPKYTRRVNNESSDTESSELRKISDSVEEMYARKKAVASDNSLSKEDKNIQMKAIDADIKNAKTRYLEVYKQQSADKSPEELRDDDMGNFTAKYSGRAVSSIRDTMKEFKQTHPEAYDDLRKIAARNAKGYVKDNAGEAVKDYYAVQKRYRTAKKSSNRYSST